MSRWRFLLAGRWAGYLSLTIIVAVVCCLLGNWQFARRAEARVEINRIEANWSAEAIPVGEALPELTSFEADQKWQPVQMTGTYLADEELLVRNRPMNGQPGFEVLTPLLLNDGTVFIVDRGWLPTGSAQDSPDTVPAPPTGEVVVEARLKAGEPTLANRGSTGMQIATIQLDEIAERLDRPVYTGAYGLMSSETPAPGVRPIAAVKPPLDEGPHLSYALQWYVFALLAFIALGWAIRQEFRFVNAEDPDEQERAADRARRLASRPRSDADIEDDALDTRVN